MAADPIVYCLQRVSDYREFERFCSALLTGVGYPDIEPLGGTGDKGRDAVSRADGERPILFAYTARSDWRIKLVSDCKRIEEMQHYPKKVVFVCTETLSATENDDAHKLVSDKFGWELDLFDVERIRANLVGTQRHLVAQHPAIFAPPFFPQRGGQSIAECRDTVLIDHHVTDHALASWIARQLSLRGFQVWCHGMAPLAGENADETVRQLTNLRAVQYLPLVSPISAADGIFLERCALAASREDFVIPCAVAAGLEGQLPSRLKKIVPAQFATSWREGLNTLLARLRALGVEPTLDPSRGTQIALKDFLPAQVTVAKPEPVFANVFPLRLPLAMLVYDLQRSITDTEAGELRKVWAFVELNAYLSAIERLSKLDAKPALAICVVPDEVYENCRPNSNVAYSERSDVRKSSHEVKFLERAIHDNEAGQTRMFDDDPSATQALDQMDEFSRSRSLSPDFRRQLKARMMEFELPVQIIKESTLRITPQVRNGEKGTNPLSDRLWNFGTAVYYKCGSKPWKAPWAREGVCYVGLAYKLTEDKRDACCAAQMFLDSGDGVVFVGEFGPWYSRDKGEFHLPPDKAEALLRGTMKTYREQDGRPLKEIFLHARSGIDPKEYEGFKRACPPGVKLVAIRVRQDRNDLMLYRYDDHPDVAKRGQHPVQRGVFWQRTPRHGLLFTNGFKPRIGTYDGFEVPVPLAITVQHGEADLLQVAKDILGLTKLNYNACQLGEGQPITVKYSDRVGEILLANPGLPAEKWKHNFRYYI